MACRACEKASDKGLIAWFRIEEADIGLIGCAKHLSLARDRLRIIPPKAKPKIKKEVKK